MVEPEGGCVVVLVDRDGLLCIRGIVVKDSNFDWINRPIQIIYANNEDFAHDSFACDRF